MTPKKHGEHYPSELGVFIKNDPAAGKLYLERVLVENGGNVSAAARSLHLDRQTFWHHMRKAGVNTTEVRQRAKNRFRLPPLQA